MGTLVSKVHREHVITTCVDKLTFSGNNVCRRRVVCDQWHRWRFYRMLTDYSYCRQHRYVPGIPCGHLKLIAATTKIDDTSLHWA